ncbi:MAG: TRAP transporter substrate-binding protein DctP [Peptococcaceae bacterium]|jgi:TRAP-type C4-dicarboxylate transport system substrate-binding protein|nr:TRAP transporter substrate-binding protein DctP [Peptococcaceae bacterium]
MLQKRIGIIIGMLLLLLGGTLLLTGCQSQSTGDADADQKVKITYVTWKRDHHMQAMAKDLIARIESKSDGRITFESKGDEEVVEPAAQIDAVLNGVFDAGMIGLTAMADRTPLANAMTVIPLNSQQQKEKGIYDLFQQEIESKGLYYICNLDSSNYNNQFRLWLNKEISKPEELSGLRLRTIEKYASLAKDYNAFPQNIPAPELYSSVQQKLVDGYFMSFAAVDLGLGEITKYYIDPGFGRSDEIFYMSLKKWNSIPEDLQKLIIDEVNATEKDWEAKWSEDYAAQKAKVTATGVQELKLADDIGQEFVAHYNDLVWEDVLAKAPEQGAKLRELAGLPPLK